MLLLSPTKFEAAFLQGRGEPFSFRLRAGIRGEGWVWLESGIGKVNTAMTLAAFAAGQPVSRALLFGIAGAYPRSGLKAGGLAFASEEVQADLGLRHSGMAGLGFASLEASSSQFHNHFPLNQAFTDHLNAVLQLPRLRFITRDLVSETVEEAEELSARWQGDLENMEGAAFAQACLWLGVQGAELRAVSNLAGVRDRSQWRTREAVAGLEAAVLNIIGP